MLVKRTLAGTAALGAVFGVWCTVRPYGGTSAANVSWEAGGTAPRTAVVIVTGPDGRPWRGAEVKLLNNSGGSYAPTDASGRAILDTLGEPDMMGVEVNRVRAASRPLAMFLQFPNVHHDLTIRVRMKRDVRPPARPAWTLGRLSG
jgi:hypothetical protein